MLTKVEAYSAWNGAPTVVLNPTGREETDLIQVRDIQGLDPVKATINTSPFGSVDGVAFVGTNVPFRNIILTLHPNPDWMDWTFENLRRLLYLYFMPKLEVKLIFYSDDIPTVEISGYVESCDANPFTKDPQLIVSIICPDPYFTAVDPTVITGVSGDGVFPTFIDNNGSIESGFVLEVVKNANPDVLSSVTVQIGDPSLQTFKVTTVVNDAYKFAMSSVIGKKYVQKIATADGVITDLYQKITDGYIWPILLPGENAFSVITDAPGKQNWTLTYYERLGGL